MALWFRVLIAIAEDPFPATRTGGWQPPAPRDIMLSSGFFGHLCTHIYICNFRKVEQLYNSYHLSTVTILMFLSSDVCSVTTKYSKINKDFKTLLTFIT